MSILSFFRKPSSEEAARFLVEQIVLACLLYSKELAESKGMIETNDQRSASAGIEVAYLLLHLLDMELFAQVEASRRDALFDPIAQAVIVSYLKAALRPETPTDLKLSAAVQMQETLNERQITYSKCHSVFGDSFPGIGTMIFAFCFFVRRALGQTNRIDFEDILSGDKDKFSEANSGDFPDAKTAFSGAVWIGAALKSLKLQEYAKYLGRR